MLGDKNDVMVGVMSQGQVVSNPIPMLTFTSHEMLGYLIVFASFTLSEKQGQFI